MVREAGEPGFSGETLEALRHRPERRSPLPGLLDPEPGLTQIAGKPKTLKTTFGLALAQAWAAGVRLWPGTRQLPATRSLVLSAEQPAVRIEQTLRRLDTMHPEVKRDAWTERMTIVARDRDLPRASRSLFDLGDAGMKALRGVLRRAEESQDPYGLILLDSLSRLKPADAEENSNDAMSAWLGPLQEIAETFSCYVILVHHIGHAGREDIRTAGRGASAIEAVCQGLWMIEETNDPRFRVLRIAGNALLAHEVHLEIAPEGSPPGTCLYFRPHDPLVNYNVHDYVGAEWINSTKLAWKLSGKAPDPNNPKKQSPPGNSTTLAADLRDHWKDRDLIEVRGEGQRGKPTELRLKETPE